jgi:small multidrug resistance family-3 protein
MPGDHERGGDRAMSPELVLTSLALFALAGLCEIGGGYLVWLWLREGQSALLGALGGMVLFVYGVVPTLQPAPFGRVYAAYGGVFVILSLLWGALVGRAIPDRFDLFGGLLCLAGVAVIMYWPRP